MKRKILLIILAALVLVIGVISVTAHAATVDGCDIGTYTLYDTFTATDGLEGTWTQNHPNSSEAYGKLVDGNTATKWCTISQNSFNTIWIEFNASEAFIPKGYLLTTGGDTSSSGGRNPKNWTIEAKLNENDSWTTIASVTEDTVLQAKDTTTYNFPLESNTAAYKYFRFEITAIQGISGEVDWTMQLAELRFYGDNSVAYYAAKAATCTETGNVEYYYRLSDGKYFSDSGCTSELAEGEVFIAALGHDCVEGETVAPTCTDDGYTVFSCTRCDHTEHRNTVSSPGHTWGDWSVTTPATCTAEGKSTRICSVCGAQENEAIPVIDHTWGDWSVTTPATCTEAGEKTRACSECGAQESEATAALGHVFDNGVCTRCGITPTEISDWAALKAAFAAGGSYKLVADVSGELSDGYLNVPAGITVWLDLNGHSAGRDLQYGYNLGFVIKVAGTLTVSDGVGGGTITGGNNYHTFMNNDSEDCAGGVTVKEGGVFTLYGGSITGNKAYSGANGRAYGGGVYVDGGATFVMNGGSITGNMATCSGNIPYGGGVCVDEGGTFEMNGGSITGNRLISNNKLYYGRGAGVYVKGTFNVSGLVTVSGNLMSKDSGGSFDNQDVYLESDCLINVVGPLDPASLITYYSSHSPTNDPKIITNGLDGNGTYRNFATSKTEYSEYDIAAICLSGTEAAFCEAYRITVDDPAHGEIDVDGGLIRVPGETITVTVTPDNGYYVSGVTYTDAYEPYPAAPTGTPGVFTFTMPYYNSTVSATMAETPAATVAGGIENGAVSLSVGGTPIASGSRVLPGTVVTVTATDDDGYGVSSVTVGGEPITAVMGTYSFTMPTTDVTVSATFSTLYKVTINGSRNVTLIPDKEYAVAGETVTITAECRYGYTVDHIYDMYGSIGDIYPENDVFTFTMPSNNVEMNAILRSPKVTFNYSSYNGTAAVVGGEYNPAEGDTVTVRLTPDDGYLSWSMRVYYLVQYDNQIDIDSVFDRTTGIGTFTMPAGEVIVEVYFSEYRSVTIDNISGGTAVISVGGNVVQSGARVAPGETVTVTFNAASGHNFVDKFISIYWYDEDDDKYECYWSKNDNVYTFTMPEYYVYIDAVFPSDNIHIEITGEGTATASRYYAEKDEEVSVYVEPADGYYLKRIGDNSGNDQFEFRNDRYYFSMGEDAVTICVTFAPLPTVTVPDMEHGSAVITVYGNTVASGSGVPVDATITVTYTANDGYYISRNGIDIYTLDENDQKQEVDFYLDDTDTDHLTLVCHFDMPEDDVVIGANFDSDNVQIVIVGEGTAIADRYYTILDDIHLSISPAEGYILKGVTVEADEGWFDYEDSYVRFGKEQTDVTITVTFVSPTIDGHRMQLESEIGVGFKVNFNGGYGYDDSLRNDCYVTFSVSDGRKGRMDGSEASEENGYFWFTGYVNALELADEITATLHSHDGSVLATNTYSAMEYIEYVKENMSGDTKLIALVGALQDYGHYLQGSGWTDNRSHAAIAAFTEISDDVVEALKNEINVDDRYAITKDLGAGIESAKFSLTLNERTVVNIKVKPSENVTVTEYDKTETSGNDTYYVIKSDEINASGLLTKGTITVKTSAGDATFDLSAAAYIRSILNNESQTAPKKYAMAALDNYAKAAYDYSH